jgi:hypothetical protein
MRERGAPFFGSPATMRLPVVELRTLAKGARAAIKASTLS